MTTPLESVIRLGGIAATHELLDRGHTRHDLADAVRRRRIFRVRKGWYCRPDLHPDIRRAVRVGGVLTCASAIRLYGGWAPDFTLHVALPDHSSRPRTMRDSRVRLRDDRTGIRLHWLPPYGVRGIAEPLDAIDAAVRCLPEDEAAAAVGTLLHTRPDLAQPWRLWLATAPYQRAGWLARIDGGCEWGAEMLCWWRMQRHGLPVRRQVPIAGIGRVDFLIGSRLVIEVDGAAYHTSPESFEVDRRRDAALGALGYRVLRFSYRQVVDDWPSVEAAVLAAVARGDAS